MLYAACLSDAGLFGFFFYHKNMEEESRRCSFYKFKEVAAFSEILHKITYVHWNVYATFTCFHSRVKYMHHQLRIQLRQKDP